LDWAHHGIRSHAMSEKSIIIIGAGLAGLSTGCYAQMNGYSSRIFEHHSAPGGVVAAWRRKDYLIDGGIHFLMGHKPGQPVYDLYRELGATEGSRFLDMMSYARYVDEITDRSVNVTPDLDRLAADLKSWSPADAPTIDDLIAGARAMRRSGMSGLDMAKPRRDDGLPRQGEAILGDARHHEVLRRQVRETDCRVRAGGA
jgi:phytoene desaturase